MEDDDDELNLIRKVAQPHLCYLEPLSPRIHTPPHHRPTKARIGIHLCERYTQDTIDIFVNQAHRSLAFKSRRGHLIQCFCFIVQPHPVRCVGCQLSRFSSHLQPSLHSLYPTVTSNRQSLLCCIYSSIDHHPSSSSNK